ncbi:MAG: cytochrome c-type biogenesis protein CcmH [Parvularculaceae bacterium]
MTMLSAATLIASPARAVEPDEVLSDPVLEERAREISRQLRCVVCQSQNIDDSNAPLAKDMRILVRERIMAGDTDEEVIDYLVERYGDYVLLNPPVQSNTLVLWAAPGLALLGAAAIALFYLRRLRTAPSPAPLSEEEERRIDEMLD